MRYGLALSLGSKCRITHGHSLHGLFFFGFTFYKVFLLFCFNVMIVYSFSTIPGSVIMILITNQNFIYCKVSEHE